MERPSAPPTEEESATAENCTFGGSAALAGGGGSVWMVAVTEISAPTTEEESAAAEDCTFGDRTAAVAAVGPYSGGGSSVCGGGAVANRKIEDRRGSTRDEVATRRCESFIVPVRTLVKVRMSGSDFSS
jgi:hypothetical protein